MPLIQWNGPQLLKAARAAGKKALASVGGDIVRDAKRYAPVGVAGQGRRGIAMGPPKETGTVLSQDIGFTPEASYMQYVELGRRAGKRPPPSDALILWVKRIIKPKMRALKSDRRLTGTTLISARVNRRARRMRRQDSDIKGLAFVIARAIGKRGIKPRRMIGRAADTHAGQLPALFAHEFQIACDKLVPKHT